MSPTTTTKQRLKKPLTNNPNAVLNTKPPQKPPGRMSGGQIKNIISTYSIV